MTEELKRLDKIWFVAVIVVVTAVALLVGYGLSGTLFPKPQIGLVYVDAIIDPWNMPYFTVPLHYAAENDDIAAVVLIISSPGGEAVLSEELFYRTIELRSKKPVVASIHRLGASGAYYVASGANYIYAKPSALVGSIGVISSVPEPSPLDEYEITTGPFKGSGSSEVDWVRSAEVIKEAFVTNVYDQRLYALEHMHPESRADVLPDKDSLATGQVWIAPVAYDIGLIDGLGSDLDAIEKAARLAHISNYEVVDLTGLTLFDDPTFFLRGANLSDQRDEESPEGKRGERSGDYIEEGPWPTFYHLYIPPAD